MELPSMEMEKSQLPEKERLKSFLLRKDI